MDFNDETRIDDFMDELRASPEWNALLKKTQVFNFPGEGVKTRGLHCLDVGDISEQLVTKIGGQSIQAKRAFLSGLLHDLGHIPFGHAGESIADSILKKHAYTEEERKNIRELKTLLFGEDYVNTNKGKNGNPCFEHNENSVLQYIILCNRWGYVPDKEIELSILAHSTSRYLDVPKSLVAQAVRLADKVAYINYDIDDLRASFKSDKEETEALDRMYSAKPYKDPDGNDIKIVLSDGRELTLFEFTMLDSHERIRILIDESVREAKAYFAAHPDLEEDYESFLTGCNDVSVRMAQLRKQYDREEISKEEYEAQLKPLKQELYERSPIMYAAYEIKERTDAYIRTGEGLTLATQEKRTYYAQSAVGNEDLKNEYIYKSLVTLMERIIEKGIAIEQLKEPMRSEFIKYEKFKEEHNNALRGLPGNDKGLVFPEIYTIVNFIGTHSNEELLQLAKDLGIIANYDREVLPLIQAIQESDELYDKKNGVLTEKGRKLREAIVTKYGAKIHLSYGLDEEDLVPTVSDELVELLELQTFSVDEREEIAISQDKTKSGEERLKEFKQKLSQKNQEYIDHLMQTVVRIRQGKQAPLTDQDLAEVGRSR